MSRRDHFGLPGGDEPDRYPCSVHILAASHAAFPGHRTGGVSEGLTGRHGDADRLAECVVYVGVDAVLRVTGATRAEANIACVLALLARAGVPVVAETRHGWTSYTVTKTAPAGK